MSKRWIFVEDRMQHPTRWSWRQLGVDGRIEQQSEDFDAYGFAVRHAISRGFNPKSDHWVIESSHNVVHHESGKDPLSIPKKEYPSRGALRPIARRSEKTGLRSKIKADRTREEQ